MQAGFLFYNLVSDKSSKPYFYISEILGLILSLSLGIFLTTNHNYFFRQVFESFNISSILTMKAEYLNYAFSIAVLSVIFLLIIIKFITVLYFSLAIRQIISNFKKAEDIKTNDDNLFSELNKQLAKLKGREMKLNHLINYDYESENYLENSTCEGDYTYKIVLLKDKVKLFFTDLIKGNFKIYFLNILVKLLIVDSNFLVYIQNQYILTLIMSCSMTNNLFSDCNSQNYIIFISFMIIIILINVFISAFLHYFTFSVLPFDGILQIDYLNSKKIYTYFFKILITTLTVFYFNYYNRTFHIIIAIILVIILIYLGAEYISSIDIYNSEFYAIFKSFTLILYLFLHILGLIFTIFYIDYDSFTPLKDIDTTNSNSSSLNKNNQLLKNNNYEGSSTLFIVASIVLSLITCYLKQLQIFKSADYKIRFYDINSLKYKNEISHKIQYKKENVFESNDFLIPDREIYYNYIYSNIEDNYLKEKNAINTVKLIVFHINNINSPSSLNFLISLVNDHKLECTNKDCKCDFEIKENHIDQYMNSIRENMNPSESNFFYINILYFPFINLIKFLLDYLLTLKNYFKHNMGYYLTTIIYLTYLIDKNFYQLHILLEELKSLNLSYKEILSANYLQVFLKKMIKSESLSKNNKLIELDKIFNTILSLNNIENEMINNIKQFQIIFTSIISSNNINISYSINELARIDQLNKELFRKIKIALSEDRNKVIVFSLKFNFRFLIYLGFFKSPDKSENNYNNNKGNDILNKNCKLVLDYDINMNSYLDHFKFISNNLIFREKIPNNKLLIEIVNKTLQFNNKQNNIANINDIINNISNQSISNYKLILRMIPVEFADTLQYKISELENQDFEILDPAFLKQDKKNSIRNLLRVNNLYEPVYLNKYGITKSNFLVNYNLLGAFYSELNRYYFLANLDKINDFTEISLKAIAQNELMKTGQNKLTINNNNYTNINQINVNEESNIKTDVFFIQTVCCITDLGRVLAFSESFGKEFCLFSEVLEFDDFEYNLFSVIPELDKLCGIKEKRNLYNADNYSENKNNINNIFITQEAKDGRESIANNSLNQLSFINNATANLNLYNNTNNLIGQKQSVIESNNTIDMKKKELAKQRKSIFVSNIYNKQRKSVISSDINKQVFLLGKTINNSISNNNNKTTYGGKNSIVFQPSGSQIKQSVKEIINNKQDLVQQNSDLELNSFNNLVTKPIPKKIFFTINAKKYKELLLKNQVYYNLAMDYNKKIKQTYDFFLNNSFSDQDIKGSISIKKKIEYEDKKNKFIINKLEITMNVLYVLHIEIYNPKATYFNSVIYNNDLNLNLNAITSNKDVNDMINNRKGSFNNNTNNNNNNNIADNEHNKDINDLENFLFGVNKNDILKNKLSEEMDDIFIPEVEFDLNNLSLLNTKNSNENIQNQLKNPKDNNTNQNTTNNNNSKKKKNKNSILLNNNNNNNNNNNKADVSMIAEGDDFSYMDNKKFSHKVSNFLINLLSEQMYKITFLTYMTICLIVCILFIVLVNNNTQGFRDYFMFYYKNLETLFESSSLYNSYLIQIGLGQQVYYSKRYPELYKEATSTNLNKSVTPSEMTMFIDMIHSEVDQYDYLITIKNKDILTYYNNNLKSYYPDFYNLNYIYYPIYEGDRFNFKEYNYDSIMNTDIISNQITRNKDISKLDPGIIKYYLQIDNRQDKIQFYGISLSFMQFNYLSYQNWISFIKNYYNNAVKEYINLHINSYLKLDSLISSNIIFIEIGTLVLVILLFINLLFIFIMKMKFNKINQDFIDNIDSSDEIIIAKQKYLTEALNFMQSLSNNSINHLNNLLKLPETKQKAMTYSRVFDNLDENKTKNFSEINQFRTKISQKNTITMTSIKKISSKNKIMNPNTQNANNNMNEEIIINNDSSNDNKSHLNNNNISNSNFNKPQKSYLNFLRKNKKKQDINDLNEDNGNIKTKLNDSIDNKDIQENAGENKGLFLTELLVKVDDKNIPKNKNINNIDFNTNTKETLGNTKTIDGLLGGINNNILFNKNKSKVNELSEKKPKTFSSLYSFSSVQSIIFLFCFLINLVFILIFLIEGSFKIKGFIKNLFKESIILQYSFISQIFSSTYILKTYYPNLNMNSYTYSSANNDTGISDETGEIIDFNKHFKDLSFVKKFFQSNIDYINFDNKTIPKDYINYNNLEDFKIENYFKILQYELYNILEDSSILSSSEDNTTSLNDINISNLNLQSILSFNYCKTIDYIEEIYKVIDDYNDNIKFVFQNSADLQFIKNILGKFDQCRNSTDDTKISNDISNFNYILSNNYITDIIEDIYNKQSKESSDNKQFNDYDEIKIYNLHISLSFAYYLISVFSSNKELEKNLTNQKHILFMTVLVEYFVALIISIIILIYLKKTINRINKYQKFIFIER